LGVLLLGGRRDISPRLSLAREITAIHPTVLPPSTTPLRPLKSHHYFFSLCFSPSFINKPSHDHHHYINQKERRIVIFRHQAASKPSTDDIASQGSVDSTCDASLMGRGPTDIPASMTRQATDSLQPALDFEQLRIYREEQQICIGNPRGSDILREFNSLRERLANEKLSGEEQFATMKLSRDEQILSLQQQLATMKLSRDEQILSLQQQLATMKLSREEQLATEKLSFENQIANLQAKITSHDVTISSHDVTLSSHESQIRRLTVGNEAYQEMRSRFISSFKRDDLDWRTEDDRIIINTGNLIAHGGDAVVDATLYFMPQGRNDRAAFEELYGFPPWTVLRNISGSLITFLPLQSW